MGIFDSPLNPYKDFVIKIILKIFYLARQPLTLRKPWPVKRALRFLWNRWEFVEFRSFYQSKAKAEARSRKAVLLGWILPEKRSFSIKIANKFPQIASRGEFVIRNQRFRNLSGNFGGEFNLNLRLELKLEFNNLFWLPFNCFAIWGKNILFFPKGSQG